MKVLERKRFGKINIEVSNVCNLQCSFCPPVARAKGLMPPELFRNIIEQAAPLTDQVCLHLMGDPLVHPKLEELVRICKEHEVKIFLVTNGVLLRERQAELLLDPAFRQICFSLHSFHDNFPGTDSTSYLEKIFSFTEAALERRPELYINYRLWNLENPRGTGAKNREILSRVEARFGATVNPNADARIQKSRRLKNRLYLHFDTEFIWPGLDLARLGETGTCHALNTHFGILIDGTVVPCCLDKEGAIPLGKIQEKPLLEIFESPRAAAMLKGFRERKLVEALCQRCQYIERFS
ncbi:MAG: radical SAM protein [Oligoflexia bacterium]|nr:radical SAM protein [Oligoflexia bacterium]